MVQVHDRDVRTDVPTTVPVVATTNPPSNEDLTEVSRKNVFPNTKSGHRRGIYMKVCLCSHKVCWEVGIWTMKNLMICLIVFPLCVCCRWCRYLIERNNQIRPQLNNLNRRLHRGRNLQPNQQRSPRPKVVLFSHQLQRMSMILLQLV